MAAMNVGSSMPSRWLKARMCGNVASPTPTMPISANSTSVALVVLPRSRAIAAAAIQPAVPSSRVTVRMLFLC